MFKNTLLHSQELKNFVYQAEMHPVAKRLDLDQLIGCVLHRITKYPLLLNELKKCTKDETSPDFSKINEAIKLSKDLACFVNLRYIMLLIMIVLENTLRWAFYPLVGTFDIKYNNDKIIIYFFINFD